MTRARGLDFEKYQGLGNDFVVVDAQTEDAISVERAREICDRRLGIGADGVLLVLPPKTSGADARMVVINADGSIPEMCGNGLRCVALHVARQRAMTGGVLTFDTGAGALIATIDSETITIDMGPVRFTRDVTLHDVDATPWELSLGDAGNPHAITRRLETFPGALDKTPPELTTREEILRIGPRIEKHPEFPAGTNVEFTIVRSPTVIDLVVWERGVGITHACGTGACATVAVAVAKGWSKANTDVTVNLPGGPLVIRMNDEGHAIMRGPARHVFSGRV